MEKSRIALLIVAIVAAFGCLGYMGVNAFCDKVYKSRDCEFANTENIEMHARIDIPSTTDCACEYDNKTRTKRAVFDLEKESLPEDYIVKNKFIKTDVSAIVITDFGFEKNRTHFFTSKSLYYREGKTTSDDYKIIFDKDAGKIWVNLKYLD
jgi:hypothetical protein